MIATLKYDLSKQEDVTDHLRAVNSQEMAFFIWNLKHNTLRKIIKDDMGFTDAMELIEDQLKDLSFDIDEMIK